MYEKIKRYLKDQYSEAAVESKKPKNILLTKFFLCYQFLSIAYSYILLITAKKLKSDVDYEQRYNDFWGNDRYSLFPLNLMFLMIIFYFSNQIRVKYNNDKNFGIEFAIISISITLMLLISLFSLYL